MKKLLLASAVAALSISSANAATDVYGRVVADLRYAEDGDVTLDNGSTRLGVKGSTALTANTDAIYQLEYSANLDEGKGLVKARDTYIGLQNAAAGTLKAGHLMSIDDDINFTNPSDYWASGFLGHDADRVKNAIAYATPSYDGLQLMAMYKVTDAAKGAEGKNDGKGSFGLAGAYDTDTLKLGASYIKFEDSAVKNSARVSGAVNLTPEFVLSAAYQIADYDTDDKENSYIVAAEYDIANSPWATYIEYDGVTNKAGKKDADKNIISLGGVYAFNKAVSGRVYAGFEDQDDNDKFGVGTGITYKF